MIHNNKFFIFIILCLQTIYNCITSITGQYIYKYFLEIYPENGTNNSLILNNDDTNQCKDISNNSVQNWAQEQSADLLFRMTLSRAFPVIIITYLFGIYASYFNRKLILIISIFGNAVHVIIYQAIIYKQLDAYWWCISACIAGLSGGTNIIGIVINLIITESTNENERSSCFVRLGALTTGLSAIVTLGIGYYIQRRGFTDLYWIAIGLEFLSILSVIFILKTTIAQVLSIDETTSLLSSSSTNQNHEINNRKPSIFTCFDLCKILNFQSPSNSPKKSLNILLILICYIFYTLAVSSLSPLLWYLLASPFCWTSKDLGNFSAISLISTAIFSVIGMKILLYIGANDAIICAIGHICLFGYSLWTALAKTSLQLFLSLLINPFSGYQSALTIPMISKYLDIHERNQIFTLITEINTIIVAFGSSAFNWLYARTVNYQKNLTLLVASGLCILPFILNICLIIINRQNSNEEVLIEGTTISLSNNIPPQAVDITSLVLPIRSRTNSINASYNERSRSNSQSSTDGQIRI